MTTPQVLEVDAPKVLKFQPLLTPAKAYVKV
jgi:hypothetical protein